MEEKHLSYFQKKPLTQDDQVEVTFWVAGGDGVDTLVGSAWSSHNPFAHIS